MLLRVSSLVTVRRVSHAGQFWFPGRLCARDVAGLIFESSSDVAGGERQGQRRFEVWFRGSLLALSYPSATPTTGGWGLGGRTGTSFCTQGLRAGLHKKHATTRVQWSLLVRLSWELIETVCNCS
jgi:hypothetical protein